MSDTAENPEMRGVLPKEKLDKIRDDLLEYSTPVGDFFIGDPAHSPEEPLQQVFRLTTSYWKDSRGTYCRKSLQCLRRLSNCDWIDEEIDAGSVDLFWKSLTNIDKCKDGLYVIETCNESRSWESSHIDGYDYVLKPYIEPLKP